MLGNINRIASSCDHGTTGAEARRKTEVHLNRLAERYSDRATITSSEWNDEAVTTNIEIKGQKVKLVCSVSDNTIDAVVHIPLLAVPFKGKIKERLDSELMKVLAIK